MYYNCGIATAKKTNKNSISLFNMFALVGLQKLIMVFLTFPIFPDHFAIPGLFQGFPGE